MPLNTFPITAENIKYSSQRGTVRMADRVYNIRIQSPFVLTPHEVKRKLGTGYRVLSTEVEGDVQIPHITDTLSAMNAIIKTDYRALARANHPDLGGDAQVMVLLNQTRKELEALLQELSI